MKPKTRVLLVDDSSFMRMVLTDIVNAHPDIEVIDTATNGKEAVEKAIELKPDVVLLDLTMKDFDGMYAINRIMTENPLPIVILSSLRSTNPSAAIEALKAGAIDFLDKPTGINGAKIRDIDQEIYQKIKQAAGVDKKVFKQKNNLKNTNEHNFDENSGFEIVAIGSSTGGTGAIEYLLQNLPSNWFLPIVIAQHMPAIFIKSFAERLDLNTKFKVKIAEKNESIKRGTIYLLPGDVNTQIIRKNQASNPVFDFSDKTYKEFNFPSVDCLFESVAEVYGSKTLAVILTGMGKDGTNGISKIFEKNGFTVAQDEKSSIVWGMPKAAYEAGVIRNLVSLQDLPGFLVSAL